ncbi:MAG: hypothetical protein AAF360_03830 [Pseudomonadota bacterium]
MAICDCDLHEFPPLPDIAPGLTRLPRQIGLFGDFRAALLAEIRTHDALADWRARDREDFGLMMLEWWAYVSDVVAFYNAEHAQDLYLGTARDEERVRRIVGLIGYRPRPAFAAEARIAAIIDGAEPVTTPARTGFIADATDDAPPQQFELEDDASLDPLRNKWTIAPIRQPVFNRDEILIDPGSRNLTEGQWAVFVRNNVAFPQKILAITQETELDGNGYQRLEVSAPAGLPPTGAGLGGVELWSFTQSAPVHSQFAGELTLIGLFPQIRVGELMLLEDQSQDDPRPAVAGLVDGVRFDTEAVSEVDPDASDPPPPIMSAVTKVKIRGEGLTLLAFALIPAANAVFRFGRIRAGKLVASAKPFLDEADISAGPSLAGRLDGPGDANEPEILLKGVRDRGARMPGDVVTEPSGRGALSPSGAFAGFEGALRTPVEAFGNVMRVTRGKTVEEVLGGGAGPGVAFQSFTLSQAPLTYVFDPAAPGGRRSTLAVFVDGIEWTEVETLFLSGSEDRVYTVDLDPDGKATITFGDGNNGLPPALGEDNVFARYRYGAGDPPPKANTIRQISGPAPRLRRIFNVTDAFGGGPGDKPEDIRFNAPASAATFDRAVSAADFAAFAKAAGALAATAATEWVADRLREGVVVVAVFEGEATQDAVDGLQSFLAAKAAETTPIRVVAAVPIVGELRLSYRVADDANPADVEAALNEAFLDPFTGMLAPRRAAVGGPIFRSALIGRAAKVGGIEALLGLTLDGTAAPARFALGAHDYFAPTFILEEVTQ